MDVPSMVQRSGDKLIVRSVVSGNQIFMNQETGIDCNLTTNKMVDGNDSPSTIEQLERYHVQQQQHQQHLAAQMHQQQQQQQPNTEDIEMEMKDDALPQCKIKRNYSCGYCPYFTQNPRYHLTHLRDVHGEKIIINKCKLCLYASRHYQKLVRHMRMVHGSTEGIEGNGQTRKRQNNRDSRKRKIDNSENVSLQVTLSPPRLHQSPPEMTPVNVQLTSAQPPSTFQPKPIQQMPSQNVQFQPLKISSPIFDDGPQNRLLKCSVCDFTTLYRAQLVDHELDEHDKTKFFRCEKCSYVTHIKARFSKHVKYHSMPMIKCCTCDFRTPYKWNLDRHMKNHGGSGPFKCAACDFTADIKQSLTVHEMNHHVPPVGHAAGMNLARRRNKVGATDSPEDCLSDNGDLEDPYNNNNNNILDDFEENYGKKSKYDDEYYDQPTDLSQKGSSPDSNQLRKTIRPVPNLIPIQSTNALNLSKDLAMSRNSLKDIASLFFGEHQIPEILLHLEKSDIAHLSPTSTNSSTAGKRKTGINFFDKIKEIDHSAGNENLICACGHISKCLSESIIHRKSCMYQKESDDDKHSSPSPINLSVNNSGSTRCQQCRQRCKSSVDLLNHMQTCVKNASGHNDSYDSMSGDSSGRQDHDDEMTDDMLKHPMENRVFVWNKIPEINSGGSGSGSASGSGGACSSNQNESINGDGGVDLKKSPGAKNEENSYYGVETAPGYGEVTKKMTAEEEAANSSLKKVYKCPHCPFWASTASRFHVHIVGHLNKKPFECSLCAYRSNWRWDITKHIRLKTIRDPSHKNARVLMNDETGRRNYTKYNKYITLMKVTDEDGDPKLMKSGEMTPNQEASMALINEYNKSTVTGPTSHGPNGVGSKLPLDNDDDGGLDVSSNEQNAFNMLPQFFANMLNGMPKLAQQLEQEHHSKFVSTEKRSPPPLIKASDDLITDIKTEGTEKKTFYKCRKCNFRHGNRDAVLAHVKIHYEDVGGYMAKPSLNMPLQVDPNVYMNNVFAAMCLSQQQLQMAAEKSGTAHSILSGELLQQAINNNNVPFNFGPNGALSILPSNSSKNHNNNNNSTNNNYNNGGHSKNNDNDAASVSITLEHGETDEASCLNVGGPSTTTASSTTPASSGTYNGGTGTGVSSTPMVMGGQLTTVGTINNNENEWRGPAPYRCGHCHQVSNWKHVIQRHCRLKHAGDIRIETVDRSSDRLAPVYLPLSAYGQQALPAQNTESKAGSLPSTNNIQLKSNIVLENVLTNNNNYTKINNNNELCQNDGSDRNIDTSEINLSNDQQLSSTSIEQNQQMEKSRNTNVDVAKSPPSKSSKQQQCPSCPYISESKSQMNYHISLHKTNQYECNLCGFICTKKQQLTHHNRSCHEDDNGSSRNAKLSTINTNTTAIDLRSKLQINSNDFEKTLSFCQLCPSRFTSQDSLQQHLSGHGVDLQCKCEACDFSSDTETILLAHSFCHTSLYQEETEKLYKRLTEDHNNTYPNIQKVTLQSGADVWIVKNINKIDTKLEQTQTTNVVSNNYAGENSLLKKQLETCLPSKESSPVIDETDFGKCIYCPFETHNPENLSIHLMNHIIMSKSTKKFTCDHCDYSVDSNEQLIDHVKVHFQTIEKSKSVAFYTSYDNLELNLVVNDETENDYLVADTDSSKKLQADVTATETASESFQLATESQSISCNLDQSSNDHLSSKKRCVVSKVLYKGDSITVKSKEVLRKDKRSSRSNSKSKKDDNEDKHTPTILVNPKTGQVIDRS